jgi:hypothetical protein
MAAQCRSQQPDFRRGNPRDRIAVAGHAEINNVIRNIRENCDFLRSIERPHLVGSVFNMFVAGVTCVKHKGFHEEREWRVLYAPNREPSPLMERSIETIGGVPQIVYKAPLDRNVSQDLADIEMSRIFDRLIIGPSPYPWVMYQAFVAALDEIEVPEAGKRVFVSDIRSRAWCGPGGERLWRCA